MLGLISYVKFYYQGGATKSIVWDTNVLPDKKTSADREKLAQQWKNDEGALSVTIQTIKVYKEKK